LIKLYIESERMRISPLPKAGITKNTFEGKKTVFECLGKINHKRTKNGSYKIEKILPKKQEISNTG
jgi:hypothetical protein